ncbi:hypothetical protein RKD37_003022 [Streptomyces ambofaciens]
MNAAPTRENSLTARPRIREWAALIDTLPDGRDLASDETAWARERIMAGEVGPAALLVALRAKGETAEEVEGLTRAMLRHATRPVPRRRPSGWPPPRPSRRWPGCSPGAVAAPVPATT